MEAILESFHAIRIQPSFVDDIKAKFKRDPPKEPAIQKGSVSKPIEPNAVTYINDHIYILSPN
jgi:hypothetical protein